jgi:hypothetical protein
MRIVKIRKDLLKQDKSIAKIDFFPKTYIVIDEDRVIYFGNSFIDNIKDDYVYCLEWEKEDKKLQLCKTLEDELAKENNKIKMLSFYKSLNEYVKINFTASKQNKSILPRSKLIISNGKEGLIALPDF